MTKVFLGGTWNESSWRDELIEMLEIDWFNPVVDDWTPECMEEELAQREECDYCLYVITPEMTGVYSIAEAVDDSNTRPEKTVFCVLASYNETVFSYGQIKSLIAVGEMVERNGGRFYSSLIEVAYYLNMCGRKAVI